MAAIAALALGFAIMPLVLSAALAVAVVGILVLDGLNPPRITEGVGLRRWLPWTIWSLALATCPIATGIVGSVYEKKGAPPFGPPYPWATGVVNRLGEAHLGVSVVAAIAVVVLTRGRKRWLAWSAVLAILMLEFLVGVVAWMATTGIYL